MRAPVYWQSFREPRNHPDVFRFSWPAPMPDGRILPLPIRPFDGFAVAGLIANQASFVVLDQLARWVADRVAPLRPEVVIGLPTLGHTVAAAVARALGHSNWVAPSTTRKLWYDDSLSVPLGSITAPALGANTGRRMWLDPRLLTRLRGRRVLLIDDVISTGNSANAGLALLQSAGIAPLGLAVAMVQGRRWMPGWAEDLPVLCAFQSPLFHPTPGGWLPEDSLGFH